MTHINIGSNLGDRHATLLRAVALLEQRLGAELKRSETVESLPLGFDSPNAFMNIGVAFDSVLTPLQTLDIIESVQREIDPAPHRDAEGGYIDRIVDIDLIACDGIVVHSPRLTLPHPRMHMRPFVLIPMTELEPQWRHPLLGLTPHQLLTKFA